MQTESNVKVGIPKITVITPSFNQGQYLEETIRSVISQRYPNLEYIIIDGGSTDNSVEIIHRYEHQLSYWVSEPDRGQAHAINKGFERCTGDLVGWINSDDMLMPGALELLASTHVRFPDSILAGDVLNLDMRMRRRKLIIQNNINAKGLINPLAFGTSWHQPGIYVPIQAIRKTGFLDESLRYLFDQEWLYRLIQFTPITYLRKTVAMFRLHNDSKTVGERKNWLSEFEQVVERYGKTLSETELRHVNASMILFQASIYLSINCWDRNQGIRCLKRCFRLSPKIIFIPFFWQLVSRTIFPFRFMVWVRSRLARN